MGSSRVQREDWAGLQLLTFSPPVCLSYPSCQLFPINQSRVRHAPSHVRLAPSQFSARFV